MNSRAGDPGTKCRAEHVQKTTILVRTWSDRSGTEWFTVVRFFLNILLTGTGRL